MLPTLRRRFRLVLVDNLGTGRSDRPDGSFAVTDMAGDVVAVLDAVGTGRVHVQCADRLARRGCCPGQLLSGW